MNNKTKENFNSDFEKNTICEEEIVLAPQTELYEAAKNIAISSAEDVRYPFVLKYDANHKEFLLDIINCMGGITKKSTSYEIEVLVNMEQLKLIKSLEGIDEIRENDVSQDEITMKKSESDIVLTNDIEYGATLKNAYSTDAILVEGEESDISTSSTTTICTNASGGTMEDAVSLTLEEFNCGQICCHKCEAWYKFDIEEDGAYTIYTKGGLDTIGILYDSNGYEISRNDDHDGVLYFKIQAQLFSGNTYYIKVSTYGEKTGSFCIRVTKDILVTSVVVSTLDTTLNIGDNIRLTATVLPANATDKKVYWSSSDVRVVKVNRETGLVTALKGGNATIYAFDRNNDAKMVSITVKVNYCGGVDYKDVTKHTMTLSDDGYYVCSKCGYKVKSPELQDHDILSTDDYLQVISAVHFYTFSMTYANNIAADKDNIWDALDEARYKAHANTAERVIAYIRRKSKYIGKYDYVDSSGLCYCENIGIGGGDTAITKIDVSGYNILWYKSIYSGAMKKLTKYLLSLYSPKLGFLLNLVDNAEENNNLFDFAANVAKLVLGNDDKKYAITFKIAAAMVNVAEFDLCIGDKIIEIYSGGANNGIYVYDSNNNLKFAILFGEIKD